ncbi:MAG: T9SS type A sorting domain-containing protein [Bacteroidia bacterium]
MINKTTSGFTYGKKSNFKFLILFLVLISVNQKSWAQAFTGTYPFTNVTTASGLTDPTPVPTAAGVTFGSFTAVGQTVTNPNAASRFSFTGQALATTPTSTGNATCVCDGSILTTRYYQVTVTVTTGFTLNLSSITFTLQRSGTGIRQYAVRSDADSYVANLAASISPSNANLSVVATDIFQVSDASAVAENGSTVTLSGAGFTGLTSGSTRTFRFYGWNAEASGGTFSIDNVVINGTAGACAPTLAINTVTNTCTGTNNGAIDINVSGGISPFTYLWSNSATTEDISGVADGTYTVTVTSTGGCSSTISATVGSIALPTVNFSGLPASICVNASSLTLTGNQAPSGTFTGTGITDNANGTATFNPATAGVGGPYNITYTYSNGTCSNSQTQQVTVNAAPDIQTIAPVSNTCPAVSFDLSTITLTNNGASGTNSYFSSLSDANNNTNSISSIVTSSGTYYIRVTTVAGCFDVEPVTVTIISCGCANPATANAGANFSICANATAQLNGSIGGSASSSTWSGGGGTFNPNANSTIAIYTPTAGEITAGTVTLTLTTDDPDGAGPCVAATSNVTITINALPTIVINPSSTSICFGSTSGNITANGASTYSWSPNNGSLSSTTGATVTASPAATTTYTVTGTDVNGCQNTATITVTVNSPSPISVSPNSVTICTGSTSGTITASGGSTYTWANATGLSATTGSSVTANPTTTTTYTVTGTDANGCTSTATLLVNVNPLPAVAISGSNVICNGSSTILDGGAGFTAYLWSTSATSQTISTSTPGTYTVTVTDANGCTNSASKTLAISNPPVLSATSTPSTCNNSIPGTIDLTATGGTPCNANSKGLIISKISANPGGNDSPFEFVELVATKNIDFSVTPYTVIFVNNGTGTTNGWIAGVALTYAFLINSGSAVAGGVYYVGGNSMPPVGNRLRTINTATIGGDGGIGNAALGGVLGNGGTNADAAGVFNLPVASITSSSVPVDAIFFGSAIGNAVVSGGTQGYQLPVNDHYSGGKLQSGSFAFGDYFAASDRIAEASGTYDVQNNTFTVSRNFANNSLLLFSEGVTGITLINTSPYFYSWSNGATTEDISGLAAGTYTATVTDCNGCSTTLSQIVSNVAPPVVSFTGLPSSICVNASSVILTGSNAPAGTFTGTGITDNANGTASFNPSAATAGGPYSITYSYTDPSTGCIGTSSQNITVTGLPDIQPISPVTNICPTATVDLSTITIINNGVPGSASYFATLADANNNINSISPVVNTSGTYYIRVTTVNGCYDVEPVVVTINGCGCANPPTASAGSNFSICANGSAQLNGSIGGGATSSTWSGGGGTFNPNPNAVNAIYTPTSGEVTAGTITLTLTTDDPDGTGPCVAATGSVTITINPQPVVTVTPSSTSICAGSSSGNIIANGASTYLWSPATGLSATTGSTVTTNPSSNTTYTVTGTDLNGCTNTATVVVTVNPLPLVTVTPNSVTICTGSTSGTITASGSSITYAWATASGLSATTGASVTANPTTTTTYTVTGTDVNGCSSTATLLVNVNPLPTVTISGSSVICNGSSTILDAGTGFVSYNWSTGASSQTISVSSAGTYTVTVTDVNGCTNSQSKTLSASPPPTISSITSTVTCLGNTGSINLTVTGGTPCAANSPGLIISKLLPNPNGTDSPFEFVELVATKNIDFSVTPYSVIFANNGTATANGWKAGGALTYGFDITTGTATAGGVYYVGGSSMTPVSNHLRDINTGTASGDGGLGNANVSGIAGNGGANADGVAVFSGTVSSVTAATAPVDAFFYGTGIGGATVSAGTQGYQLPVNDHYAGGKLQTASFFGPEPVSGEYINATGTFDVISNTYTTPRTFANSATFTEGVSGVTVITASPYFYNWSNSATTQNLTNIGAGTYTVTVSDCNGCSVSGSATVSLSSALKPYLQEGDSSLCSNDLGFTMHILDSGAYSGGYPLGTTFNFYGAGAILYQSGTSSTFFNANNSDAFYAVITLPGYLGSCSAITDTSVIDFGNAIAPQFTLGTDSVTCFGTSTGKAIANIVFGGTPNFKWHWFNSSNISVRNVTNALLTDTLSGVPAGMYTLVLSDHQDSLTSPYCEVIDSIYIGEPAAALAASQNLLNHIDNICNGGSAGAIDIEVTGGTPGYSYNWSNGTSTEDISGLPAGTYTCTITDSRGCTATITVTILQPAAIVANCTSTNSICFNANNGTVSVNASGGTPGYVYLWSNGNTNASQGSLAPGTYTVIVTDTNGCTQTCSSVVTQPAPLVPVISGNTAICAGGSTVLNAGAPYTNYSWSTGATTQTITAGTAGTFTVTVTNANGCTGSVSVTTIVNPQPVPTITGASTVCAAGTTLISATAGFTAYSWSTGVTTQSVTVSAGTYTVTVTNANGCTGTASKVITVSNSVLPQPGVITGSTAVCKNSNAAYSIVAVTGATNYTWTATSGASVSTGQGSTTVVINFSNAAVSSTISVVASNVCGASPPRTLSYTVSSVIPAQPSTINGSLYGLCNLTNVAYNCPAVANATSYLWTVPTGVTILTGQGTNAITVKFTGTFTGSGSITVAAQSGCGISAATSKTINAKPQQPVISGLNYACKGQTGVSYSVAPIAGASSYTWTIVPGSTLVSGQGTTSIVVNWGAINGVIKCKANNACGSSLDGSLSVSFTCKQQNSAFEFTDMNLYPNPASTSATIDFEGFSDGKGQLSVYDLIGQQVLQKDLPIITGNNQYQLDLSSLPKGAYTVKVIYNGLSRNCKLIVQ